jgi:hypothetical protein
MRLRRISPPRHTRALRRDLPHSSPSIHPSIPATPHHSLWLWSLVGAACLLLFSAVRPYIKTYSTRLHLPNLSHYPPPVPGGRPGEGGARGAAARFFGWAVPVFTATDGAILQTAGLDALMLTWTARIGMQIFGPLTVVGLAVRAFFFFFFCAPRGWVGGLAVSLNTLALPRP